MNFTPEQLTKAKAAKSVEELLAIAKENGMELSEEEAKNYFEQWHKEGEIADDELDNVAGGICDSRPASVDIKTNGGGQETCPSCGGLVTRWKENLDPNGDSYVLHGCTSCGKTYRRYYEGDAWTEN